MKAIQIFKYGGPEVLTYVETEIPEINPDDVLIKVFATSINPIDWKVREGYMKNPERKFPITLGWDVSGVVEQIGDQVEDYMIGDLVYARPDVSRNGTYAEYVAVRANEISFKPKTLDHLSAATIPLAGLTAWQGLFDLGKLQSGQRILIHGAAGGVGTLAVQLAKWHHAYVIATASENNIDFLKGLGADEVIDYHKDDFSEKLSNIDLVFDSIGGETQKKSVIVLKPGGILVSTVGIQDMEILKAKNIHGEQFMAKSDPEILKELAALIEAGKIKPVISHVFDLKDIQAAHVQSQSGHTRGKIAIRVFD